MEFKSVIQNSKNGLDFFGYNCDIFKLRRRNEKKDEINSSITFKIGGHQRIHINPRL